MTKYGIKDATDVKMIIPVIKLVKKNKPNAKKVTKEEYHKFIEENMEYIAESYLNTALDSYVVRDQYGNMIAGLYYYMQEDYYINPDLLELGIKKKMYIEDEYEKIGEEVLDLGNMKPFSSNQESIWQSGTISNSKLNNKE